MWQFTDDLETFAGRVWDLLAADAAQNTIALTMIEGRRSGFSLSDLEPIFSWWESPGGEVAGAAFITPPYGLLLSVVPLDAMPELVGELRSRRIGISDVDGEPEAAALFAAEWAGDGSCGVELDSKQRLYGLGELIPPPDPGGSHRICGEADFELVRSWDEAFHREVGGHEGLSAASARRQIEEGTAHLWEDAAGLPVALACRRAAAGGVARVGPVFTAPEHRRRGYASAVTAACTQAALDARARQVVLFTDVANPVSNSIYQKIGYRRLSDRVEYRFVPSSTGAG